MKKMLFLLSLIACNQPSPGWPEPRPVKPIEIPTAGDSARTAGPFIRMHPMGKYPELIHDNLARQPTLKIEEWLSTPTPLADFGRALKPWQEMEMVAFGGGLTAGVMNGGITRESEQTNYTNLLAHQMGIKNFKMPLFEKEHYNGTGYYVYRSTESGYPNWDRITNNTIKVSAGNPQAMPRYDGKVSNFGLFEGSTECYVPGWACENCDFPTLLASRLEGHSPAELSYNFIVVEEFFDRWMMGIRRTRQIGLWDAAFNGSVMNSGSITDYAINYHLRGKKGVIFTIPRYQDLPYMNWYSMKEFQNAYITFDRDGIADGVIEFQKPFALIPTAKLHALCERFKGLAFSANFDDIEVLDYGETYLSDPQLYYNQKIRDYAKEKDLAVVDLFDLYQRIHNGKYRTDDGVLIDGGVYGNFFSSDGIYPTPLGHAVIANEVVKAVNKQYGAKIPLIDIEAFTKAVEFKN